MQRPDLHAIDIDRTFSSACEEAGLAATAQRRLIYRALVETTDHPTAESVYLKIRAKAPRLSLATVYRNLRLFAEAGIIDEVATGSSFARFDGNKRPHHHLICRRCGSVTDFYSETLDRFTPAKKSVEGFEIQSAKMNLFGVCVRCAKGRKKNP
jgi:Fur family peroxide stress response transcriptional regulator